MLPTSLLDASRPRLSCFNLAVITHARGPIRHVQKSSLQHNVRATVFTNDLSMNANQHLIGPSSLSGFSLKARRTMHDAEVGLEERVRKPRQMGPKKHERLYASEAAPQDKPNRPSALSANNLPPTRHPRWDHFARKGRPSQDPTQVTSELEKHVETLKEISDKSMQAAKSKDEGPYLSEATLRDIYKDLLSYPEPSSPNDLPPTEMIAESVQNIRQIVEERLSEFEAANREQAGGSETLSVKLLARIAHASSPEGSSAGSQTAISAELLDWAKGSPVRELVRRLRVVLETLRSSWPYVEVESMSPEIRPVAFRLLSDAEWRALSQTCLDADDVFAAEAVLDLMKLVGLSPSDEQSDAVLDSFASKGRVEEADAYVANGASDVLRERQRDLLVKARVKAQNLAEACMLLHKFETRTTPAPLKSYTRVIQALFGNRGPGSAQRAAHAWDLFAHMRYVAHPVPDTFLYNIMIRGSREPQRALDLFTEMTVEQHLIPNTHTYTAVIRACARSKEFALQAFHFAREMLNSHRDAHGQIPASLRPDKHTYCGLMEAAWRIGDLARARWILAQMSQASYQVADGDEQTVYVNENALKHMFKAYAAFRPKLHRDAVPFVHKEQFSKVHAVEGEARPEARGVEATEHLNTRGMPQTSQEIIHEATLLWERILEDRYSVEKTGDKAPKRPVFGRVKLGASLLTAYIQVYYAHSVPSVAYKLYETLFEAYGIEREPVTYVRALEAYATKKFRSLPQPEQLFALSTARSIWDRWSQLEATGTSEVEDSRTPSGVEARLVERAWSAIIRLLTFSGEIDEAETFFRRFVEHYPPENVKRTTPANPIRSNRTQLYGERPLVRLMEPSAVPEDRIPPFLTHDDISLLYNRALATQRMTLVSFMRWAMSAYEGALRHRRDVQLRS